MRFCGRQAPRTHRRRLSNGITVLILWSACLSGQAPVTGGREYYVTPNGTANGAGTLGQPWDLQTALRSRQVQAGDIVWLRGGTYGTGGSTLFQCTLTGTAAKPIFVRQYPEERSTVDGGIRATGAHVWFWGFEITNSSPQRRGDLKTRPPGLELLGSAHKVINMAIHDTGQPGIAFWDQGDGGEVYGSIVWGNGIYDIVNAPGTPADPLIRGDGLYGQNEQGTVAIRDSIWFRNFTLGFKAYGEGGGVRGFNIEGNISFVNDLVDIFVGTRPRGNSPNPAERVKVMGNYTYQRRNGSRTLTMGERGSNVDAVVQDNYLVAGFFFREGVFLMRSWAKQVVTGNTVVGQGILAANQVGQAGQSGTWNNNRYYGGTRAFDDLQFHFNNTQMGSDTRLKFQEWKSATGFDKDSTFTPSYPTQNRVFVRPNQYEPGRAHIAVYNWEMKDSVAVDLSNVLLNGATFEIRDAQNYFGDPLVRGTYTGGAVSIPMNIHVTPSLVGTTPHIDNRHTGQEFGAFVAISKLPPAAGPVPVLTEGRVMNAAGPSPSGDRSLAPGSLVSIYGENLTMGATAQATSLPWPTTMGGTSVRVNGEAIPLHYVSPTQINAQLPVDLQPGADVRLQVFNSRGTSVPETIRIEAVAPGLFAIVSNGGRPGDAVSVYATGLGAVDPPVPTGLTPLGVLAYTRAQPELRIANLPAPVTFSGLSPEFVGAYQVNATIPPSVAAGRAEVILIVGGKTSNALSLDVAP
jgi:uncharacterized protein (TIGR03437 family)